MTKINGKTELCLIILADMTAHRNDVTARAKAMSARAVKNIMNVTAPAVIPATANGRVIISIVEEKRKLLKENDIVTLGGIAFGKNGGLCHDICVKSFKKLFNSEK